MLIRHLACAAACIVAISGFGAESRSAPVEFDILSILDDPGLELLDPAAFSDPELRSAIARAAGTFSLERLVLDTLLSGPRPVTDTIAVVPEFDIDIELLFENGILGPTIVPFSATQETATLTINARGVAFDGQSLVAATSGLPPGTPLVDLTIDKFPPGGVGFPNGRRVGEDAEDLILLQLFSGSLNLGVAAFDGSPTTTPPFLLLTGQISPDDTVAFASAADAAVVPLPTTLPMLLGGLGLVAMVARRSAGAAA